MKKTLLTLALVGLSAAATYAQGTIQFGNSSLSRIQYQAVLGGPINTDLPAGSHVGAYWGTDAASITGMGRGTLAGATGLTGSGTSAGLWPATGGAVVVYTVAGTTELQRVWLKFACWVGGDAQSPTGGITHYGESVPVNVTLGTTPGPGTVVWQSAGATHSERAKPFVVAQVPEPSVIALGALGLGALLLRRRKA